MKKTKRLLLIALCIALLGTALLVSGFASEDGIFSFLSEEPSVVLADGYTITEKDGKNFLKLNGEAVSEGFHRVGEDYYYVRYNGVLAKDQKIFAYVTNDLLNRAYYRFDSDCKMVKGEFLTLSDGAKVYVKANGEYASGVTEIDGDYYFFNINNGEMRKGQKMFVSENEYGVKPGIYYFNDEGKMDETPEFEDGFRGSATNVQVSNAFSDNMMLQRDQKLTVWGSADASSGTVIVEFMGEQAEAEVGEDRMWYAEFEKTFSYTANPQTLTVKGAKDTYKFKNVLIGDVYFVIGQSNVHYGMANLETELSFKGLEKEITWDYDESRNLRFFRCYSGDTTSLTGLFKQGTATEFFDLTTDRDWMCTEDIKNNTNPTSFSALGYLLAYNLSNKIDVPVGIIEIDAAGMPLISFAPNHLAQKWNDESVAADGTYYYNLNNGFPNEAMPSRFVYNHFIAPLRHFSTAGIVWYQGESDALNSIAVWGENNDSFAYQFTELMTYFRQSFGNSDFPVYMIEFPTCFTNYNADTGAIQNAYIDFGNVRCDQGVIGRLLSDFHLVNSSDFFNDITWSNSLHPYIKHKQAARLANIVLADKYGIGDLNYVKGPQFESATYSGKSATVTFTNVGSGLKKYNGNYIYGFEVWTGHDAQGFKVWEYVTDASIIGTNQVKINSNKTILGIRYNANTEAGDPGFGELAPHLSLNLRNSNNVPTSAFVDLK